MRRAAIACASLAGASARRARHVRVRRAGSHALKIGEIVYNSLMAEFREKEDPVYCAACGRDELLPELMARCVRGNCRRFQSTAHGDELVRGDIGRFRDNHGRLARPSGNVAFGRFERLGEALIEKPS